MFAACVRVARAVGRGKKMKNRKGKSRRRNRKMSIRSYGVRTVGVDVEFGKREYFAGKFDRFKILFCSVFFFKFFVFSLGWKLRSLYMTARVIR